MLTRNAETNSSLSSTTLKDEIEINVFIPVGCLIGGLCVFIVEVKTVSSEFGWSFILAWLAVAVYGAGFISLALLSHRL